jgi:hypothetical protein
VRADLWTLARLVDDASTTAVNRVRRRSTAWWRDESACAGWSRADVVAHLVAGYAAADHAIEIGAGEPPGTYRAPDRPGREPALADRLAVVAYDLVLALGAAAPGAPARYPERVVTVETVAAVMLAETLVHLHDVDPRPLPEEAAGAVLAYLHPDAGAELGPRVGSLGDLLLAVERGPGQRDREL